MVLALTVTVALAACSSGKSTTAPTIAPPSMLQTLDANTTAQIDKDAKNAITGGITGFIVSVSDPHKGKFLKAYGSSDTSGTPMTTDMHFRAASVTKTFVADAVLHLIDEKKIALNDPVSKYVPGIPNGDRITIQNLLAMRGGVYSYTNDPTFLAQYTAAPTLPTWKPDDALTIMKAHTNDCTTPNTKTVYSDSEYILLGYVIQKVTGQSAPDYINSLIKQLGLPATAFPTTDALPAPFSHGYVVAAQAPAPGSTPPTSSPRNPRDVTVSNPNVPWTAGAIVSTVPDMTRYAVQLATGTGLMPATATLRQTWGPLTTTGVRLQYGLGVMQLGDWVGHDGSIFGYSTLVFYLPRQQATVVVMANEGDGNVVTAQALWGQIVKQLYPGSLPNWP